MLASNLNLAKLYLHTTHGQKLLVILFLAKKLTIRFPHVFLFYDIEFRNSGLRDIHIKKRDEA